MFKSDKVNEQLNFKQQALDCEKMLSEQKERIFSLIDENNKLKELNDVYKNNEEKINSALILAIEKADEYEKASKLRYELEVKRIKILYYKWFNYFSKIKKLLPEDKNLIAAEKLIKDLDVLVFNIDENFQKERFLVKDKEEETEGLYQAEKERIGKIEKDELYNKYKEGYNENIATVNSSVQSEKVLLSPKEFAKIIEKIRLLTKTESHIINLEEIQNPKDLPGLDVLCSELGIG